MVPMGVPPVCVRACVCVGGGGRSTGRNNQKISPTCPFLAAKDMQSQVPGQQPSPPAARLARSCRAPPSPAAPPRHAPPGRPPAAWQLPRGPRAPPSPRAPRPPAPPGLPPAAAAAPRARPRRAGLQPPAPADHLSAAAAVPRARQRRAALQRSAPAEPRRRPSAALHSVPGRRPGWPACLRARTPPAGGEGAGEGQKRGVSRGERCLDGG